MNGFAANFHSNLSSSATTLACLSPNFAPKLLPIVMLRLSKHGRACRSQLFWQSLGKLNQSLAYRVGCCSTN